RRHTRFSRDWSSDVCSSDLVFAEIGYLHRMNDSLQNGILQRVNTSQSYYLRSKLIQTDKSDLSVFVNYRNLKYTDESREDEPSRSEERRVGNEARICWEAEC